MEKLENVIFYDIDRAIRSYRQFAQRQIRNAGFDITIDQWLILEQILEHPEISQQELGDRVFKDNASVTRIIEILVKAGYLLRRVHEQDRRRTNLSITPEGKKIIRNVSQVVEKNRHQALKGITKTEINAVKKVLDGIVLNCC